jgi:hypothetical protein
VDEYTRECLVLHAALSINGADVRRILARVRGWKCELPTFISSDSEIPASSKLGSRWNR